MYVFEFSDLGCPSKQKAAFLPLQASKLSNFKISPISEPKFKFSVSGKKNVRLFGVTIKTSVSSDKSVPLLKYVFEAS
jgi:hypothetical protein